MCGCGQRTCVLHHIASCRAMPFAAHAHRTTSAAQVDAKVEPTFVRVRAKKHTLQLLLPAEVLTDASTAQRSATTGHLVLTCPKVHTPSPPLHRAAYALPCTAHTLHALLHTRCCTCTAHALHTHLHSPHVRARRRCTRSSSPGRRGPRGPTPSPPSPAGGSTSCCPRPATASRGLSTSAGSCRPRRRVRPNRRRSRKRYRSVPTSPMRKTSHRSAERRGLGRCVKRKVSLRDP